MQTFSIGFDDPRYDELEHARVVAHHFGTDHHEFVVKPDALAILDDLIAHFDEPFGDSSAIPTWYVSEMARRHVTVVLSGDGGDECSAATTATCRIRALRVRSVGPPASRTVASLVWPLLPHGGRGKNFCVARRGTSAAVISTRSAISSQTRSGARQRRRSSRRLARSDAEARLASPFARFDGLPWNAR